MAIGSAVAFAKWINEQGNQKIKLTKEQIHTEYQRVRRNLLRNIRAYTNRGADTSFFKVPAIPKNITEKSIERLKMKQYEWNYITGYGKVPLEEIPASWEKTSKEAVELRAQSNFYKQEQRLERIKKKLIAEEREKLRKENLDNIYWQMAQEEGLTWDDLPSASENYALKILAIAYDATNPEDSTRKRYHAMTKRKYNRRKAYSFSSKQLALFKVVQKKAETAVRAFTDRGFADPKESLKISARLEKDFYDIAKAFEEWLWESDQYSNPSMSGLELVLNYATRDLPTSGSQKKALADMRDE